MLLLLTSFLLSLLLPQSSAAPNIQCLPSWILSVANQPPPDTHGCSLLLSYLPSHPSHSIPNDPPIPLTSSLPFRPDAHYYSPTCHLRLDPFNRSRQSMPLSSSAPELIFRLYSAMKEAGFEVVRQCTGVGKAGGYATGALDGFGWKINVEPALPEEERRAMMNRQGSRRFQGPDVFSTLDLEAPVWRAPVWEV